MINKKMELHEILKMPTSDGNIHQSRFRSTHILAQVLNMVDRGDSKQTIFEVVDMLMETKNTIEKAKGNC